MRKIVVMRPREWLRASALGGLDAAAVEERVLFEGRTRDVHVIRNSQAVVVPARLTDSRDIAAAVVLDSSSSLPHGYAVSVEFDNVDAESAFVARRSRPFGPDAPWAAARPETLAPPGLTGAGSASLRTPIR